jgi:hypothetical protein
MDNVVAGPAAVAPGRSCLGVRPGYATRHLESVVAVPIMGRCSPRSDEFAVWRRSQLS